MSAWGLAAVFADPDRLVEAARRVREAGYTRMDAYSPIPVDGLAEELEPQPEGPLSWVFFLGGAFGGVGGFLLLTASAVWAWPFDVGGRPHFSWPSFIPVSFELTVLCASLAGFLGFLVLCGLPRPYHPMFHLEEFRRVTRDRFFLAVEARDPLFGPGTRELLESLGAEEVHDVAL